MGMMFVPAAVTPGLPAPRPLVIVKLGGAAITKKAINETLNDEVRIPDVISEALGLLLHICHKAFGARVLT